MNQLLAFFFFLKQTHKLNRSALNPLVGLFVYAEKQSYSEVLELKWADEVFALPLTGEALTVHAFLK